MSIKVRFILSVMAFIVPLGVLFYFNLEQMSDDISFASLEVTGNHYQQPLARLVNALAQYRIDRTLEASNPGKYTAELAQVSGQIDQLLGEVKSTQAALGESVKVTDRELHDQGHDAFKPDLIASQWQAARAQPGAAENAIDGVMDTAIGLIAHVNDGSNLALDPVLGSYYMIDSVTVAEPAHIKRLADTISLAANVTDKSAAAKPEDRAELLTLSRFLKESDADRIEGDINTALRDDGKSTFAASVTLAASISPAAESYKNAIATYIATLQTIAKSGDVSADAALQQGLAARQALFSLWEKSTGEVDALLMTRIHYYENYRMRLVGMTLLALVVATGLFVFILRGILGPLKAFEQTMVVLSEGNLNTQVPYQANKDEIGKMAVALESFKQAAIGAEKLRKEQGLEEQKKTDRQKRTETAIQQFDGRISTALQTVSSAVDQLFSTAKSVLSSASDTDNRAKQVVQAVGSTSENVSAVAAAAEELSVSISEISSQMHKSTSISAEAVGKTQKADKIIEQLTLSANKIGEVVGLIGTIAGQINLLALNASIESARAGEAGKGFAVVASEVKNLASQTSKATEEIGAQIADVQNVSRDVVEALRDIRGTILQMDEIATSIASAVEEQGAATQEIARSIQNASSGVQTVSTNMEQVQRSSIETDTAAKQVNQAAQMLSSQADKLHEEVDHFLGEIKA